ncbi:transposase [Aliivibrio sifiae]|uniref:transposase n=1 Tax=Aliivibrio sifiae TaxID=566293 RepID=UPI002157C978|nr:transposase [Aliivibrio sifiae]
MSEFSKELQITAEFCHERPIDVFSKHIPLDVDGTHFKTHNTEENQHFGFAQKGASLPSVLAVTLMSTRSHLVSDAAFGPVTNSEISYAQQLVGSAPDDSLTLFDRGFTSAELFTTWRGASSNTPWLTPIKAKMRYDIVESYTEHDHLIDMPVSPQAQKLAPYLDKKWQARLISYPNAYG